MNIRFYSRDTGRLELEKVYGGKVIRWLYNSPYGKWITPVLSRSYLSHIYGLFQNSTFSSRKVIPFIREYGIKIDEFVIDKNHTDQRPYASFNNFFIRKFKEGRRNFISKDNIMPAFCEARYLGFNYIDNNHSIPVKGKYLTPEAILANKSWSKIFLNGPILVARLCPVDYHRFHFPDKGKVIDHYHLTGQYHSVNPVALKQKQNIFSTNERQVTILETDNFGKLAYIEVGAMCVGKIIQTSNMKQFNRGDEKGYFLFGGSTVIVMGEKGKWQPEPDIIKYSLKGIETFVKLGHRIAST